MPGLPTPNRVRNLESSEDVFPYDSITEDIDINPACRAIVIGVPGTLKVKTLAGNDRILPSMPAGFMWQVQCVKVYADEASTAQSVVIHP